MSVPFALVRDVPSEDENSLQSAYQQSSLSSENWQDAAGRPDGAASTAALWDALREVNDPELPISIVDMGLVVALEQCERTG